MELVTLLTPKHTSCQLGSLTEWVSSPSYELSEIRGKASERFASPQLQLQTRDYLVPMPRPSFW